MKKMIKAIKTVKTPSTCTAREKSPLEAPTLGAEVIYEPHNEDPCPAWSPGDTVHLGERSSEQPTECIGESCTSKVDALPQHELFALVEIDKPKHKSRQDTSFDQTEKEPVDVEPLFGDNYALQGRISPQRSMRKGR
jgi:hypothetical protein